MKGTLISMLAVAVLAGGICFFSLNLVEQTAEEMDGMRLEVLREMDAGDVQRAQQRLREMAEAWSRRERTLAVIVPHDALHRITELIIEGGANLAAEDADDFSRSMALLGEAIRHLHEGERPGPENIW